MGAVILPLMGIYLLLLIVGTAYGWRWAKRRGYSTVKRAFCALGGFLIVYLPLMWDWIPTELAHRYYCKKEAGLWIYKTLDQWKAENPGVYETLVYNKDRPFKWVYRDKNGSKYVKSLNGRINYSSETIFPFLSLNKDIFEVIDTKNDEVLAKYIDFGYGISIFVVRWADEPFCENMHHLRKDFFNFEESFKGAEK